MAAWSEKRGGGTLSKPPWGGPVSPPPIGSNDVISRMRIKALRLEDNEDIDCWTHQNRRPRWKLVVTYSRFFWTMVTITSVLSVVERFQWNIMPAGQLSNEVLNTKLKACSQGSDGTCEQLVVAFFIIQMISARLLLVCTCLLFLTMCRTTHNILTEAVSRGPSWLRNRVDFSDASDTAFLAHRFLGLYGVTLLVLVHVVSAFLPVFGGGLELSVSDEPIYPFAAPHYRKVDFLAVEGRWTLRPDDLYQVAVGVVAVFLIQPLTMIYRRGGRWRRVSLALILHVVGAVVFAWLILRVREHLRALLFVTPFVGLYVVDRIAFNWFYRKHTLISNDVVVIHLDRAYAVIFTTATNLRRTESEVGDSYNFNLKSEGTTELHEFYDLTCPSHFFHYPSYILNKVGVAKGNVGSSTREIWNQVKGKRQSRFSGSITPTVSDSGHNPAHHGVPGVMTVELDHLDVEHATMVSPRGTHIIPKAVEELQLTKGVLQTVAIEAGIQGELIGCVVKRRRGYQLRSRGHMNFPLQALSKRIRLSGPYRGVYRRLLRMPQPCPYVLFGTGTGVGYILDFVYWVKSRRCGLQHPVQAFLSTGSLGLTLFATDELFKYTDIPNLSFSVCTTSDMLAMDNSRLFVSGSNGCKKSDSSRGISSGTTKNMMSILGLDDGPESGAECRQWSSIEHGRIDVTSILAGAPRDSEVYFCGSSEETRKLVVDGCKLEGLKLISEPYHS